MRASFRQYLFSIIAIVAGTLFSAGALGEEPGQEAFDAGIAASRADNHEEALAHFTKAREQGRDSAALYHNLGVTYFKLGRYDKAEQMFRRASRSAKMAAISYYNLGLVEEKRGNPEAARKWFDMALAAGRTPKLRRLAERKLGLRETVDVPYSGYIELFGGHDDNPHLVDETADTLVTEEEGDAYLGGLAVGRHRLTGDSINNVYVYGSGYSRNYFDVDEENTASLSAGVGAKNRAGEWRNNVQLGVHRLWLDGDDIQTGYLASARTRREIANDLLLGFRLTGESLNGADDNGFGYLSGERYRFRARLQGDPGALHWDLAYEFTHNDRDDLVILDDTGSIDTVFSVSPRRHELEAGLDFPLAGLLKAELSAEYRLSDYSDPEVRNGAEVEEREDDRYSLRAGLAYPLGVWTSRVEITHWDNDSNFDQFDYERTDIMFSIGRYF